MTDSITILLDTNILIASEPALGASVPVNAARAMEFVRYASNSPCRIFYHPSIVHDIARDSDIDRSQKFQIALRRYNELPSPPKVNIISSDAGGCPEPYSNDWVDNQLLAAVYGKSVGYLVTEDKGVHRKANRLGISENVLNLSDALGMLSNLFDKEISPPPFADMIKAHEISHADPIFCSLQEDYDEFDKWFSKCQREQRDVIAVRKPGVDNLSAICIIKPEESVEGGCVGKTLKLCTFKVAEERSLYGELLLKTVFKYALKNRYQCVYFTVFSDKYPNLVRYTESFGFKMSNMPTGNGEVLMVKQMVPPVPIPESMSPFEYHVVYGPHITTFDRNQTYIVPVQPKWCKMLFPELEPQKAFFDVPCGNSIKKVYLSHSPILKIMTGDNLVFYRSEDRRKIVVLAIVEDQLRSCLPSDIVSFSGVRSVYTFNQIEDLCGKGEVLAIKFRVVHYFLDGIDYNDLIACGGLVGAPQSIQVLNDGAKGLIQSHFSRERLAQ